MSTRLIALILVFSLGLVAVSLYVISSLDTGEKPAPQPDIITMDKSNLAISSDFTLYDVNGGVINKDNFRNKYSLLYFGFTNCPDFCDETLTKISRVISIFDKKELSEIQFLFVSVDPKRDTKEALQKYISNFDSNIIGISGELKEIEKITGDIKAYFSISQPTESDSNYYVDHSSFIYLLDKKGILVDQFTPHATPERIIERIKFHFDHK